jgi:acyl-[acyl-carrier-protein] desaturase
MGKGAMSRQLTDREMLRELEPMAAANVNRHLSAAVQW